MSARTLAWACAGAGLLLLALPVAEAEGKACPSGMSSIDGAFCIDRFEASLVETTRGGSKPFSPFHAASGHKVRAVSRRDVTPQAHISRDEAEAACKASHKRLCKEQEWDKACRGRNPTRFPYGDVRKPAVCNDVGQPPLRNFHPDLGPEAYTFASMNDARLNQQPNTVARTGQFARCTNSYGVFDMVGNLHEWVDDPAGTFRGGYFLDTRINGDGCDYRTVAHEASYHDYSTGFRCCADLTSKKP